MRKGGDVVDIQSDLGGSAFPTDKGTEPGMSLRDWFAGQALAGYVALGYISSRGPYAIKKGIAGAYVAADLMLEAREKGKEA